MTYVIRFVRFNVIPLSTDTRIKTITSHSSAHMEIDSLNSVVIRGVVMGVRSFGVIRPVVHAC